MARGTVTHAALERLVMANYRMANRSGDLVVGTIDRLIEGDRSLSSWLADLSEEEHDDLVARCVSDVTVFLDDWPRLPQSWTPTFETTRKYKDLFDGEVTLWARFDLTLGHAIGTTARRLIVDFKTGNQHADHAAEARFYALVETLRQKVPPHAVGTYYLETGRLVLERVDEPLLYQAADRLIDGIRAMWQINTSVREPVARPGGLCSYCSFQDTCDVGTRFLADRVAV